MMLILNLANLLLLLIAGFLLASRVWPRLFHSADVSGRTSAEKLDTITRNLSHIRFENPETELLKEELVKVVAVNFESLGDKDLVVADADKRAFWGLILLIAGTTLQSVLAIVDKLSSGA